MEESVKREIERLLLEQVKQDKISSVLKELFQSTPMIEPVSFWYNYGKALKN